MEIFLGYEVFPDDDTKWVLCVYDGKHDLKCRFILRKEDIPPLDIGLYYSEDGYQPFIGLALDKAVALILYAIIKKPTTNSNYIVGILIAFLSNLSVFELDLTKPPIDIKTYEAVRGGYVSEGEGKKE